MRKNYPLQTIVLIISFLFFLTSKTQALDYAISFTATGASTTLESVIVQNMTKGTTVTVPTGNVLNLLVEPNAVEQVTSTDEDIRVYPNSTRGKFNVSFLVKHVGNTKINAFSIDGKKITGITNVLQTGRSSFELSLPKGVFIIQVTGNGYKYSAKTVNQTSSLSKSEIVQVENAELVSISQQKSKTTTLGITTMTYNIGDRLLYKGISGNYSTIVTDVPTTSKTTNFEFVECKDADGNDYTVVKIGTQTWMAENLKATKYKDGTAITLVTDNNAWRNLSSPSYCWYNNDATKKNTYGALYNWYAVNTGKLAPNGWHVATDAEWTILENYQISNGGNYDGTTLGNKYAKSLAATTNWNVSTSTGSIGNDPTKNNSTGFSALAGGYRDDANGPFAQILNYAVWWSSTDANNNNAWGWQLSNDAFNVNKGDYNRKSGCSVRCIRDSQ